MKKRQSNNPAAEFFYEQEALARKTSDWSTLTPYGKHIARLRRNPFAEAYQLGRIADQSERMAILDSLSVHGNSAKDGRIDGLYFLACIASEATRLLNQIAGEDPQFVAIVSAGFNEWPVLCHSAARLAEQNLRLLRVLGIPKADTFQPTQVWASIHPDHFKGKDLGTAKQWAIFLFFWLLDHSQCGNRKKWQRFGISTKVGMTSAWSGMPPDVELQRMREKPDDRTLAEIRTEAAQLPEFSASTCKSTWWPLASRLLTALTAGKSDQVESLRKMAGTAASKRSEGDDAVLRSSIKTYIGEAFKSLPGKGRGRRAAKGIGK